MYIVSQLMSPAKAAGPKLDLGDKLGKSTTNNLRVPAGECKHAPPL